MRQDALRVLMITDGSGDVERIAAAVCAAVAGGVRAVQVREPAMTARRLVALCARLAPVVRSAGGVLLVNDRADLAAAACVDGVHLGQRSLDVAAVRGFLPTSVVGVSAHDPAEIEGARRGGADYVTLSPVHATGSKPGSTPLGVERAAEWTSRAGLPVLWLGGFDAARARALPRGVAHLAGVAVLGALADPDTAAAEARALVGAVDAILGVR